MFSFDPREPFPLIPESEQDYAAEQAHAARVDAWLGLATAATEKEVGAAPGQQNWAGLPIQALMTPYTEIRFILEQLAPAPGETLVDLGAAYGRVGFVMARHFPNTRFIGYELERVRVLEGQRCLRRFAAADGMVTLEAVDLEGAGFQMPFADYYFIYDYGTRSAIEKTLAELRQVALLRPIAVIGRGRRVRDLIEQGQPWLAQVVAPIHFDHFSIYRSAERLRFSS